MRGKIASQVCLAVRNRERDDEQRRHMYKMYTCIWIYMYMFMYIVCVYIHCIRGEGEEEGKEFWESEDGIKISKILFSHYAVQITAIRTI